MDGNQEKVIYEIEKLKAEAHKLKIEGDNLKKPFLFSPTNWGILATAIVAIGGFAIQIIRSDLEFKKAEVLKESAILKAEQAEERTKKAEQKFAEIEAKTKETETKLAEVKLKIEAGKPEEAKGILKEAQKLNQAATTQSSQAKIQFEQSSKDSSKFTSIVKETLPVRIFPHIANESQRKRATEISDKLKAQNFNVLGIDNVEGEAKIPDQTQVRYFRPEDKDEAESLLKILKRDFQIANAVTNLVSAENGLSKTRHLEIWFSANAFTN